MKSMCQEARRNSPSVAAAQADVLLQPRRPRGSRRPRPRAAPRRRARRRVRRARLEQLAAGAAGCRRGRRGTAVCRAWSCPGPYPDAARAPDAGQPVIAHGAPWRRGDRAVHARLGDGGAVGAARARGSRSRRPTWRRGGPGSRTRSPSRAGRTVPATEAIARKRVMRAPGVTPPVPSPAARCGGCSAGPPSAGGFFLRGDRREVGPGVVEAEAGAQRRAGHARACRACRRRRRPRRAARRRGWTTLMPRKRALHEPATSLRRARRASSARRASGGAARRRRRGRRRSAATAAAAPPNEFSTFSVRPPEVEKK